MSSPTTYADLLKRAAEKLHERAEAAPRGPWTVAYLGDRGYPQRVHSDRGVLVAQTCEGRRDTDPVRYPAGTPEYIALMHPPVALALATLMEAHVRLLDAERAAGKPFTDLFAATELFDIAREILREADDA